MAAPTEGVWCDFATLGIHTVKVGQLFHVRGNGNDAVVRLDTINEYAPSGPLRVEARFVFVSGTLNTWHTRDDPHVSISPIED